MLRSVQSWMEKVEIGDPYKDQDEETMEDKEEGIRL